MANTERRNNGEAGSRSGTEPGKGGAVVTAESVQPASVPEEGRVMNDSRRTSESRYCRMSCTWPSEAVLAGPVLNNLPLSL